MYALRQASSRRGRLSQILKNTCSLEGVGRPYTNSELSAGGVSAMCSSGCGVASELWGNGGGICGVEHLLNR
eukprot:6961455-Ditylum_brightwellii.AAC.2